MFKNMAVEHPITGVVRDKGDVDPFLGGHHHGVLPFVVLCWLAVPGNHAKAMAVKVDRMRPSGSVFHLEHVRCSQRQR